MDNKELLLVGAVALGAYLLFSNRKGSPAPAVASQQPQQPPFVVHQQPAPQPVYSGYSGGGGSPVLATPEPQPFVSAYPSLPELVQQIPFQAFAANPALLPVWLGTSPVAAEVIHQLNEVITHLIGQETGLEKGNITLMTSTGPFILSRKTGKCYNLGGEEITCPKASTVTGIERHSYEQLVKEGLS
jgi:hypothetical protein